MLIIRRGLAYIVDLLISTFPWVMYGHFWGQREPGAGYSFHLGVRGLAGQLIIFLPFYLYMILSDYLFGRSVGKWLFRLRVVKKDAQRLTIGDAVKRHLLDFIELILIPIIAFFSACADKSNRRLGDLIAGTVVVDQRTGRPDLNPERR